MSPSFLIPPIPLREMTPTVKLLLTIIEQQQVAMKQLEAKVARLKKLPPRPNIKPSTVSKYDDKNPKPPTGTSASTRKKRPGSRKRRKRLKVHQTVIVQPNDVPEGSRFLGYQDYLVQDLIIMPFNTCYASNCMNGTLIYPRVRSIA